MLLVFAASAQAATTYYVNRDTGNDANAGTLGSPLQHAQYCMVTKASAGDTCKIVDTTNRTEDLNLTKSGTAGNPITLTTYNAPADVAQTDPLALLSLTQTITGCQSSACGKILSAYVTSSYVTIDHIDVSNQEANASNPYQNTSATNVVNGIQVDTPASNVILQSNYVHELCGGAIVYLHGATNGTVQNNYLWKYGPYAGVILNGHNNLAQYNDLSEAVNHPAYWGAPYTSCPTVSGEDSDFFRVEGYSNTFHGNYMHDLYDASNGSTTLPNNGCNGSLTQTTTDSRTIANPYCTGSGTGTNANNFSAHHDCIQTCASCGLITDVTAL